MSDERGWSVEITDWTETPPETLQGFYENFHANVGLNPGEIVAVPSELPNPEGWEVLANHKWWPLTAESVEGQLVAWTTDERQICRPINKEAGE